MRAIDLLVFWKTVLFTILFTTFFSFANQRQLSIDELLAEDYTEYEWEQNNFFSYLEEPRCFLLSYQFSGSTWCRYAIEYLTKRPTIGKFQNKKPFNTPFDLLPTEKKTWGNAINASIGSQYPDMGIDFSKSPLIKVHDPYVIKNELDKPLLLRNDKIILIVRDFKEHFLKTKQNIRAIKLDTLNGYFLLLHLYDGWDKDKRLLVYYEDLKNDPSTTFRRIVSFLDEKPDYIDNFILNLSFHCKRCLALYNTKKGRKNKSSGSINPRSTLFSKNELDKISQAVQNKYPLLYDCYLKRY